MTITFWQYRPVELATAKHAQPFMSGAGIVVGRLKGHRAKPVASDERQTELYTQPQDQLLATPRLHDKPSAAGWHGLGTDPHRSPYAEGPLGGSSLSHRLIHRE
jgi:hypothetical protein